MIRLPVAIEQRERKLSAAHRRLSAELGREPTPHELAAATGLGPSDVATFGRAPRVTTSLDKAIGSNAEMTLGSLLPADGPEIGEELHLDFQRDRVLDAVATIEEPGQSVIRLRFGLDDEGVTKSYAAIGRELELDPEGSAGSSTACSPSSRCTATSKRCTRPGRRFRPLHARVRNGRDATHTMRAYS